VIIPGLIAAAGAGAVPGFRIEINPYLGWFAHYNNGQTPQQNFSCVALDGVAPITYAWSLDVISQTGGADVTLTNATSATCTLEFNGPDGEYFANLICEATDAALEVRTTQVSIGLTIGTIP
jgi:hypothetical protein